MVKRVSWSIIILIVVTFISMMSNSSTYASLVTATDQGWYSNSGTHNPSNQNYIAGTENGTLYRNWFVFDTSSLGTITSASLRIHTATISGPGTYTNYDYTGNITDLTSGAGGVPVYVDLGTGSTFATNDYDALYSDTVVDIALNSTALASLNAATGLWALGGTYTGGAVMFGSSGSHLTTYLVVPEPPINMLLVLTILGVVGTGLALNGVKTELSSCKYLLNK